MSFGQAMRTGRSSKVRVIDSLRKQFPGQWTYNSYTRHWTRSAPGGFYVYAVAVIDGDDDTFRTQYLRSDTGTTVYP